MKQPPLIRLVDDDPTVAQSLTFVLEVAGLQVKSYDSAERFLAFDDEAREGCLLLDVRMPGMTGLELQSRMRSLGRDLPIVFLSAHGDIEMALECVRAGAVDFLVKPPRPEKLVEILKRAAGLHELIRSLRREWAATEDQWAHVTAPEREAAELIAKGLSNREIAEVLSTTEEAVRSRRASLFAKLELRNAVELADAVNARRALRAELERLRVPLAEEPHAPDTPESPEAREATP